MSDSDVPLEDSEVSQAKQHFKRAQMSAAEQYTYNNLPQDLRQRKEAIEDTIDRMAEFLSHLIEYGEELQRVGAATYTGQLDAHYNPEHVLEREGLLGPEFAGELDSLRVFDEVQHTEIRIEAGKLGKDFVKKVTALQQLLESFAARFEQATTPFTRSKEPELEKFEKELHQRLVDINYLTKQHAELMEAAQDAKAGDEEQIRNEIIADYEQRVAPLVQDYEASLEGYRTLSKFSFRKRKGAFEQVEENIATINALNAEYAEYTFIEFVDVELPKD